MNNPKCTKCNGDIECVGEVWMCPLDMLYFEVEETRTGHRVSLIGETV